MLRLRSSMLSSQGGGFRAAWHSRRAVKAPSPTATPGKGGVRCCLLASTECDPKDYALLLLRRLPEPCKDCTCRMANCRLGVATMSTMLLFRCAEPHRPHLPGLHVSHECTRMRRLPVPLVVKSHASSPESGVRRGEVLIDVPVPLGRVEAQPHREQFDRAVVLHRGPQTC